MLLALLALALFATALSLPLIARAAAKTTRRWRRLTKQRANRVGLHAHDPGRERRAEQRARELLRSCVNDEEWAMYRDLGFIRVEGKRTIPSGPAPYAYLIYPHKPILAYLPQTGRLLNEYCVAFPDETRPYGSARLPDSDDVLAKWMALTGDERHLVASANMHLPGRQVDPRQVRRDLWRLQMWERERTTRERRREGTGSLPAP